MEVIKLKEYQTYNIDNDNNLLKLEHYLKKNGLKNVLDIKHREVHSNSYVGFIKCHNLQIEILPKLLSNDNDNFIIRNLIYMLSYTHKLDIHTNNTAILSNSKNPFLEILISQFATSLFENLKRQTPKEYINICENLTYMKGKLDFSNQLRFNSANQAKCYCWYDEFSEDNNLNQLFLFLSTALYHISENYNTRKILKQIINLYQDITFKQITYDTVKNIKLSRNQKCFEKPFNLAKMFLKQSSIDFSKNRIENISLLWDMNVLFEEYVFEVMKRRCPKLKEITSQKGKRLLEDIESNKKTRNTFVDILINKEIVLDTKYKIFKDESCFDNADVFQVMTYCLLHKVKRAILIYPQWDKDHKISRKTYLNNGKNDYSIQFATVNLRQDLKQHNIEKELMEILNL